MHEVLSMEYHNFKMTYIGPAPPTNMKYNCKWHHILSNIIVDFCFLFHFLPIMVYLITLHTEVGEA